MDANSTSSMQTTGGPEIETSWPGWMKSVSQCQPDIVAIQETKITSKLFFSRTYMHVVCMPFRGYELDVKKT